MYLSWWKEEGASAARMLVVEKVGLVVETVASNYMSKNCFKPFPCSLMLCIYHNMLRFRLDCACSRSNSL